MESCKKMFNLVSVKNYLAFIKFSFHLFGLIHTIENLEDTKLTFLKSLAIMNNIFSEL